jgi:hypothetical protein
VFAAREEKELVSHLLSLAYLAQMLLQVEASSLGGHCILINFLKVNSIFELDLNMVV